MRVLFIGGTGFISTSVSKLAVEKGLELFLLNRGRRQENPPGTHSLLADIEKRDEVVAALGDLQFDAVVDWIAFTPEHIERDLALFRGRTKQYVFISSAAVYQKPPTHYIVTESTPLSNPRWQYGRDKIACEDRLTRAYREEGFPVTIVRPALTYAPQFPIAIGGWGCYTLADRMMRGLPIIVHGDGASLWVVTHSEDFGRGFLGLLGNSKALGHAFHITSDEVLTWNQIYETIADALGVVPKIVHIPSDFIADVMPSYEGTLLGDKTWSTVFDNSKIKSFVPGFEAVIPFPEGIRRTVAWFDADPARKRVDDQVNQEMDAILRAWGAVTR